MGQLLALGLPETASDAAAEVLSVGAALLVIGLGSVLVAELGADDGEVDGVGDGDGDVLGDGEVLGDGLFVGLGVVPVGFGVAVRVGFGLAVFVGVALGLGVALGFGVDGTGIGLVGVAGAGTPPMTRVAA